MLDGIPVSSVTTKAGSLDALCVGKYCAFAVVTVCSIMEGVKVVTGDATGLMKGPHFC
jgi:hypothetical protein